MKECILDSKNYLHLKTYNYIINISNPWTNLKPFHIIVIRQACQSRFTGLSASRTGLTQTFSTVPMLETVGIFYFFANSSKLDLLFNKKSFHFVERICGLAKDRTWIWSFGNSCTIHYTTRPIKLRCDKCKAKIN